MNYLWIVILIIILLMFTKEGYFNYGWSEKLRFSNRTHGRWLHQPYYHYYPSWVYRYQQFYPFYKIEKNYKHMKLW